MYRERPGAKRYILVEWEKKEKKNHKDRLAVSCLCIFAKTVR